MYNAFRIGVISTCLLVCFGCGSAAPPENKEEVEELYESEDYQKQMQGEMDNS